MPGRHRKPGSAARRLVRAGVLGVMAGAPLLVSATAMAAPSGAGPAPEKRADHDDEDHDTDDILHDEDDWSEHPSSDHEDVDERVDEVEAEVEDREAAGSFADTDEADDESDTEDADTEEASHVREASAGYGSGSSERRWDRLAECESSQDWNADTGNGYRGGLQFSDSTWREHGGRRYAPSADQASREEQIAVAEKVQREQGWNAWPSCSRQLGYA